MLSEPQCIVPMLIVLRVANGSAVTSETVSTLGVPTGPKGSHTVGSMAFAPNAAAAKRGQSTTGFTGASTTEPVSSNGTRTRDDEAFYLRTQEFQMSQFHVSQLDDKAEAV
jgi:hypothetical protein